MTIHTHLFASALLAMVPVTAIQAAGPGEGSSGMLGNHPAVIARLRALPSTDAPQPVPAALGVHPAVAAHLLMLGGTINEATAPHVKTAFTHVDRTRGVHTAALVRN